MDFNENSEQVLVQLRTKYRMRQPRFAGHKLIQAARRWGGTPVHFFNASDSSLPVVDFGFAPGDIVYDGGRLYVGSNCAEERNSLWHDLCHVMVAEKEGKLGKFNFDSTQEDEVAACKIELWLGYMTGYYSYEYLTKCMNEYQFDEQLAGRENPDGSTNGGPAADSSKPATWFTGKSVEELLLDCRKKSLRIPGACRLARELGVYSKAALVEKMREPRKLYS